MGPAAVPSWALPTQAFADSTRAYNAAGESEGGNADALSDLQAAPRSGQHVLHGRS